MRSVVYLLFAAFAFFPPVAAFAQSVAVKDEGDIITLSNEYVSVGFTKATADLSAITYKSKSLLNAKNQRGYLLGPGFSMSPSQFKIVRQTDDLVELSFYHEADNHFQYDLHYIMRKGIPGVYCFLVQSHRAGDSTGTYGQTRWGIRSDEALFDYHLVRDNIQGPMPKMAELKDEVQDWTYTMADGTVYTKYNYADYIDGRYVHGMAGEKSGLGMFVIQASHEYLNGGPTKQYQNVHSNPYLINMFNCGHFLSNVRKGDDHISGNWTKLDGPFLLYFNDGKDIAAIWKDAKAQAEKEITQWPYSWMRNTDYPLQRGSLKGKILLDGKPADMQLILAQPGYDWQAQGAGYIYSVKAGKDGSFTLPHIREGNYTLYAYGANSTDEFHQDGISIKADRSTDLKTLDWKTAKNGTTLWQLGTADRKTTGFKLSDHKREYGIFNQPPPDLDYTIGISKTTDWYYAQTKKGSWNIHFTDAGNHTGEATLTIGIAGSAKNPTLEVWVNDTKAGSYHYGNDASIYRSAIEGGYYVKQVVNFPASLLKKGENTISFKLPDVKDGGGIMYDVIKLEAK